MPAATEEDELWLEFFGPDIAEADQLNRVLDENRAGRKAIAKALRVLHDAVGAASVPPIESAFDNIDALIDGGTDDIPPTDGEKLASAIAAIKVAIDTLDPDGEGIDEPMSDSD